MSKWWWYLARSSGIVATVLAVASLGWGLLFSARATGRKLRPNWWLDLHNWLGGLALAFTGVHLVAVFFDSTNGLGLVQIFIPGTANSNKWGMTWGVIAFYVFALVVFTSWPTRRFSRRMWRLVHLLSVPAVLLAGIHAYQVGSDSSATLFLALLALLGGAAMYPLALRIMGLRPVGRSTSARVE
jgi:DMSO/TMAO reductase YedYZ heme-binding membrane subunit